MQKVKKSISTDLLPAGEELFRKIFNEGPLGMAVSAPDFRFVEINQAFCAMLGYTREELLGLTFKDITHRANVATDVEYINKLRRGEIADYRTEKRYVRKDGAVIWGNVTVSTIRDSKGVLVNFLALIENITERKKAELELEMSLTFLNRVIEQSPTPTWVSDEEGTLIRINQACCKLLNITEDEVVGKYNVLKDNIVEAQGFLPLVKNVFEKGEVAGFELKYDTAQLKHLALENCASVILAVTIFPIVDTRGNITNAVIQHVDITGHKNVEEALHTSEERYRTLVNNAAEGIFVIQDGKVVYANPKAFAMIGHPVDDKTPTRFIDFVHPEDKRLMVERYQRRLKGEEFEDVYPIRLVDHQGNTIWVQISSVLISWEGRPGTLSFVTDITERKNAEEKIQATANLYRSLIETSPDAIGLMDLSGSIVMHNRQALEVFGFEPSDNLTGKNIMDLVAPENYDEILENMQKIVEKGFVRNLELHSYKKDGQPFYIEISSSLIYGREGKPESAIIIFKDISERKRAEAVLLESENRYRLLFDNMLNGMAYCKMIYENDEPVDFIFLATNNAFERLTGLKDVKGKRVTEVIPGLRESNPELLEVYARVSLTGEPEKYETYIDSLGIWLSLAVYSAEKGYFIAVFDNVTEQKLAAQKLEKSYQGLKKTLNDAINTMAKIVEMRDPYTAGHQVRVADLATVIAGEMKLGEEQIDRLRMAAVIHDIGKMYVPSDILSKPGKLNELEYKIVKTHAQAGFDIIKSMDFPCVVAESVLQHHERMDGSGYPNGSDSKDILLEARILAVADVVEAMASHRPYRQALGMDKALEEITMNRGKLYDPQVVDACLKIFKEKRFEF
ncbi:MAG: PAS domain S-box protein [Dehalococcoidia bacterium]|nr:PAS domain S-box protein [Dehalococcoidia bacterium]